MAVLDKPQTALKTGEKNKKAFSKSTERAANRHRKIAESPERNRVLLERAMKRMQMAATAQTRLQPNKIPPDLKFTDSIALHAIETAGKEASAKAMKLMGYTIVEEKGWLIKKLADGSTEKISRI